jgi:SAM-dependent methyltransferase
MASKEWKQWEQDPDSESKYNIQRVNGDLPEMESTKQLVDLISDVYEDGMNILDVGCNVGHYLSGIRKKFPKLDYVGVDAYSNYIEKAKNAFIADSHAKFEVKNIFQPLYPDNPFDIVYSCNVLLHLPDFRIPVSNLLESTKKICFIRTLLGDNTNLVKSPTKEEYDDQGNPLDYWYLNTWKKEYFTNFIEKLGWKTTIIPDIFQSKSIQDEFENAKNRSHIGTKILGENQVIENVICNWAWVKITKS